MKKNNAIECLRVCIMYCIVIHHCIVSGLDLNKTFNMGEYCFTDANMVLSLMNSFVIVAVNIFFLISGYFGIRLSIKKIINLIINIIFYCLGIYLILVIIGKETLSITSVFKYSIYSIIQYWFMTAYIILMFISPYINEYLLLIKNNTKRYNYFLIVLFGILCVYGFIIKDEIVSVRNGYSVIYALYLYIIGNYIKTNFFVDKFNKSQYICTYILMAILNFGLVGILLLINKSILAWKMFSYNNPIILIESIALFMFFIKLECKSSFLQYIGSFGKNTLAVYLIHSMPLLITYRFYILKEYLLVEPIYFYPIGIMLYCFILYIVCLFIDRLKSKIFNMILIN